MSRTLVVLALLAGCSGSGGTRQLVVLAAASLTDAFTELEGTFEASHPQVDVVLSFGGSQTLRMQIEQGIAADVFASANARHMDLVVAAGLARDDREFARNQLALIVPASNPAGLASFEDLPRAERLVIGAPEVPAGAYAARLLDGATARYGVAWREAVDAHVVSREASVRLVLAKVELGEADAAIVYQSDAASTSEVTALPIPPELDTPAGYYIATLTAAPEPELAQAWLGLLASPEGAAILARHGFIPGGVGK